MAHLYSTSMTIFMQDIAFRRNNGPTLLGGTVKLLKEVLKAGILRQLFKW